MPVKDVGEGIAIFVVVAALRGEHCRRTDGIWQPRMKNAWRNSRVTTTLSRNNFLLSTHHAPRQLTSAVQHSTSTPFISPTRLPARGGEIRQGNNRQCRATRGVGHQASAPSI